MKLITVRGKWGTGDDEPEQGDKTIICSQSCVHTCEYTHTHTLGPMPQQVVLMYTYMV
jgi:hypothetical protein